MQQEDQHRSVADRTRGRDRSHERIFFPVTEVARVCRWIAAYQFHDPGGDLLNRSLDHAHAK